MEKRFISLLVILLNIFLFFAVPTNGQNTNHWQKISLGEIAQYGDRGFKTQYISADTIFILGYKFYYSHNGGQSFSSSVLEGSEVTFHFPSSKVGYMVGTSTTQALLKKTTNGGQTWSWLNYLTSNSLWGVDFVTEEKGVVVGDNGSIFKTSNGGVSWTQITSGTTNTLMAVKWITNNYVLVGGLGGTMLRSSDGGNTFSQITDYPNFGAVSSIDFYNPKFQFTGSPNSVTLFDEHIILATGGYQTINRSTDYGLTWTNTLPPQPNISLGSNYNIVSIINNKKAFALGVNPTYGPSLYVSENGGKDWVNYSLPLDYIPYSFDFLNHYKLFGMGDIPINSNAYMLKYDYQDADVIVLTPDAAGYKFVNKQKIPISWAAKNVGNILIEYSTNGGSVWNTITTISADSGYYLWEIPENPSSDCYIKLSSTANPAIFDINDHSFTILSEFWQMHSTPTLNNLSSAQFTSPAIAYSGGDEGTVLKSIDSAKTWNKLNTGITSNITTISFINDEAGYVATNKGEIFKTLNGGLTWQQLTSFDTTRSIKKIVAVDAFKALLILSSSNKIYLTNNGGMSWDFAELASVDTINDISYEWGVGYAVGNKGLILKSQSNFYLWEQIPPFSPYDFAKVALGTANMVYVTMPASNGIYTTSDGFQTVALKSFPTERIIMDIKATSAATAFILLSDGYIYSTDDFGQSWQDQSFRFHNVSAAYLRSFSFSQQPLNFRGLAAFAVGNYGYCYRKDFGIPTHNLKFSYQPPRYDYVARLDTIKFAWEGSGIRFVSMYARNVLTNTRKLIAENFSLQHGILSIPLQQDLMGMIKFELESSNDPVLSAIGDSIYRIPAVVMDTLTLSSTIEQWMDMSSIEHGLIISHDIIESESSVDTTYSIWTTNEYSNWEIKGTGVLPKSPFVVDNNTRYFVMRDGLNQTLAKSTDAGTNWTAIGIYLVYPFQGGYRYPTMNWLNKDVGLWNRNGIQKTTDGGFNWTAAQFNNYTGIPKIKSATLLNETTGRARSYTGEMFFSNDGGLTWDTYANDQDTTWYYQVIDHDNSFAVCTTPDKKWKVKSSVNGGSTWQTKSILDPLTDGNNIDLVPAYFINDSTGIIVAKNNTLLHTIDGGNTWNHFNTLDTNFRYAYTVTGRAKAALPFMAASLKDGRIIAFHSYFNSVLTGIKESEINVTPTDYRLEQNYPNPFNPSTKISFGLPKESKVTIKVYDVLGSEIATIVNSSYTAGRHSIDFNASGLASGIYFYSLKTDEISITKKMILLR